MLKYILILCLAKLFWVLLDLLPADKELGKKFKNIVKLRLAADFKFTNIIDHFRVRLFLAAEGCMLCMIKERMVSFSKMCYVCIIDVFN